MNWQGTRVLVTGGASFIGSHLVDALLARGARVRVVDDLTSGRRENLAHVKKDLELLQEDLLAEGVAKRAAKGMEVVFHLAAIHGGRGFVDLNNAACAMNFTLDGRV